MKCILFLFVFVVPIISISVNNCTSGETSKKEPFFRCEIVNFKPVNVSDILSVKLCLQNDHRFIRVGMYLYRNRQFQFHIVELDKTFFKEVFNEVVLRIKKIQVQWYQYKYELKTFVNGKEKSSVELDLINTRIFLYYEGWWEGNREFMAANESHSSNCPQNSQRTTPKIPLIEETIPSTMEPQSYNNVIQCEEPIIITHSGKEFSSTICSFNSSYLLRLQKELNVKICFEAKHTFERLSISFVELKSKSIRDILNDESFKRYDLKFFFFIIKPFVQQKKFGIKFQREITSGYTDFPKAELYQKEIAIIFYGQWEGSRTFSFENDQNLNNCPADESQTTPQITTASTTTTAATTGPAVTTSSIGKNDVTAEEKDPSTKIGNSESQSYVFYAAGAILLIVAIVCLVVAFLACRKTRNAKKKARVSNIRHEHLPEETESTSDAAITNDAPHYDNIPTHGQSSVGNDEAGDVTYLDLDFGAANMKPEKTKKVGKKGAKAPNKIEIGPPKGTEETIYASIQPEVMLDAESVSYANVGEHLSGNFYDKNLDEAIYANVNY